ncbi:MAG: hypothetical protein AAGB02_09255 [Pseudomonadota bacterium]
MLASGENAGLIPDQADNGVIMLNFANGRGLFLAVFGLCLSACSHPLQIIGEGDITSSSGERGCSLEEFEAGEDVCAVNLVVEDYDETYIATPRSGWKFDRWYNGCNKSLENECRFVIPADIVRDHWGETAPPLIAKFRAETTGYKSLFIGHSFFGPMAKGMNAYADNAGFTTHTQSIVFSGGGTGSPEALWNNETKRAKIQAVLNAGDVELFGMTYHPNYPTLTGYQLWFDYALAQNSETRFFIALPWATNPGDFEAEAYHETWKSFLSDTLHTMIDSLREQYPGVEIYVIPYGQAAGELYTRFANGALPDVRSLVGSNGTGIFRDNFGHADEILVDLAQLVWLYAIYGVRPETYEYGPMYMTDLRDIAESIIAEHDPHYDAQ